MKEYEIKNIKEMYELKIKAIYENKGDANYLDNATQKLTQSIKAL